MLLSFNEKNHFRETFLFQINYLFQSWFRRKIALKASFQKTCKDKTRSHSCSSDHVRLWCLSPECLGSNLAIAEPYEGDDNIATLTSVSLLHKNCVLHNFKKNS